MFGSHTMVACYCSHYSSWLNWVRRIMSYGGVRREAWEQTEERDWAKLRVGTSIYCNVMYPCDFYSFSHIKYFTYQKPNIWLSCMGRSQDISWYNLHKEERNGAKWRVRTSTYSFLHIIKPDKWYILKSSKKNRILPFWWQHIFSYLS